MLALKGVDFVDGRYTTEEPYNDKVKHIKEVADSLGLSPNANLPPFTRRHVVSVNFFFGPSSYRHAYYHMPFVSSIVSL